MDDPSPTDLQPPPLSQREGEDSADADLPCQKVRPRITRKTGAGCEYTLVLTSKNVPWRL